MSVYSGGLYRCFLGLLLIKGCLSAIVDVTPKEAVALPNENATFLCRVGVPLQYCRAEIPGIGSLNLNNKHNINNKGVSYYGVGLDSGQCGFTINRVSEGNNGKITCNLGIETQSEEVVGVMYLNVARAPKSPELDVFSRNSDPFRINDILQATCVVRDGRPVANISWFLDDEPITEGLSMSTIMDLAKEDLHTKLQNVTRQLQASDHGKHLKCVATHPALMGTGNVAMRQLNVQYPPLPQGNPIERFGYEIAQPGVISVEIEANPQPQIEWTVRDQKIRAGSVDTTGRIQAEQIKELGQGRYLVNLRIAAINKQDTETQYILTAINGIGGQDYTILISTSPEPEGLDLGVGGIIGIVVVLMLVMVLIFTVVIARIKGKWCFSGNIERTAHTENSDTESADVRQANAGLKFAMPSKITSLFKKKDKSALPDDIVDAPEDQRDDDERTSTEEHSDREQQPTEEKSPRDGVVYAELDLVKTNLKPVIVSDDEKTEYAEIVYTNDNEPGKQEKSTS